MTTIIKTPYETIEVKFVKTSLSNTTLSFRNVDTNNEFTITYSASFPPRPVGELHAWAKLHKFSFPNVAQIRLVNRLCNYGLNEWVIKNKIRFNLTRSYVTDEVLSAIIVNPYGEDFVVRKYVAYSVFDNEVKVIDNEQYTNYVLLNYKE